MVIKTDNTPDTYLPMKGSAATTAPAAKKPLKRTIPYPDEEDIIEAAAADDDGDDNPNGQAMDPKATASASKAISSEEGNPLSPTAPTPASGDVESPPK